MYVTGILGSLCGGPGIWLPQRRLWQVILIGCWLQHTNVTKPQEIPVKVELEETKKSNGYLGTDRQQWLGFDPKQEFLL